MWSLAKCNGKQLACLQVLQKKIPISRLLYRSEANFCRHASTFTIIKIYCLILAKASLNKYHKGKNPFSGRTVPEFEVQNTLFSPLLDIYMNWLMCITGLVQRLAVTFCHAAFIKWTGWTLATIVPWWQHLSFVLPITIFLQPLLL